MIRRLKSDVLTQLPSKQRQMVILDPNAVRSKTKEMESQAGLTNAFFYVVQGCGLLLIKIAS
jgi:hypothetical protein